MYHAAGRVEFSTIQTVVLTADVFQLFIKTKRTEKPTTEPYEETKAFLTGLPDLGSQWLRAADRVCVEEHAAIIGITILHLHR